MWAPPPVGGTFWFQIFIQAPSPEIWSETISGGEKVLVGKWGGLFLGYLLGKNFRRRDRDHLVPPRRMDGSSLPCRGVLSFRSVAREASGSETARVHHASRQRGRVAARGARAAADDAGDRVPRRTSARLQIAVCSLQIGRVCWRQCHNAAAMLAPTAVPNRR